MIRKHGYSIQLWDERDVDGKGRVRPIKVHETETNLFGLIRPIAKNLLLNAGPGHAVFVYSPTWRLRTLGVWSYETMFGGGDS